MLLDSCIRGLITIQEDIPNGQSGKPGFIKREVVVNLIVEECAVRIFLTKETQQGTVLEGLPPPLLDLTSVYYLAITWNTPLVRILWTE